MSIEENYQRAKEEFAAFGVDTEEAMTKVMRIPISVHCWQGDDVLGFEGVTSLDGGIQTTGNYPYRAKGKDELMSDIKEAVSLMPGKKRLNLHASYAILGKDAGKVDRDAYTFEYFRPWVDFVKGLGLDGIDFNPTFFSHKNVKDNLTLSSPDEKIRHFWIEHGKRCLEISSELGKVFGKPCMMNIWIPDGYKDIPADRLSPRLRFRDSLDEMLADKDWDPKYVIPTLESKVFGIGLESMTVGSSEFCQNYAATRHITCLMDMGHYHPTEVVSDKISSMLCFYDRVALHISRPVRWDSDHVVLFDDELREVAKEIIRNHAEEKVVIGLDYFDASINRIAAWVTGERSVEKALLYAATLPNEMLAELQNEANFTKLLVLQERVKTLPFGAVWSEYLRRQGMDENYYEEAMRYEKEIAASRK
ncbi:MAG: L-rhamnose isomerase [Eubacteriales bacterium]|nr:L-rhamnose isomerase [Eubacteriales bacterium]